MRRINTGTLRACAFALLGVAGLVLAGCAAPEPELGPAPVFCQAGEGPAADGQGCEPCPAGTFNPDEGGACAPCPAGSFQSETGSTECLACPGGTDTSGRTGSTSAASCVTTSSGIGGGGGQEPEPEEPAAADESEPEEDNGGLGSEDSPLPVVGDSGEEPPLVGESGQWIADYGPGEFSGTCSAGVQTQPALPGQIVTIEFLDGGQSLRYEGPPGAGVLSGYMKDGVQPAYQGTVSGSEGPSQHDLRWYEDQMQFVGTMESYPIAGCIFRRTIVIEFSSGNN